MVLIYKDGELKNTDTCESCHGRTSVKEVHLPDSGETLHCCIDCRDNVRKKFGPSAIRTTDSSDDVPAVLLEWFGYTAKKRYRLLECLRTIDALEIGTRADLAEYTGIPDGTLARYLTDTTLLKLCVDTDGDGYTLTDAGETALQLEWD